MEATKINETEVKKELMKSKVSAKLSHYVYGNLYYTVELADGVYQFPISTIEIDYIEPAPGDEGGDEREITKLSSDLGTTPFYNEMKGSELNRWIAKAINTNEFIKIADTKKEYVSGEGISVVIAGPYLST
jgi:hypothetical protein